MSANGSILNFAVEGGNINKSLQLPISVYLAVQNRLLRETLVRLFQKQTGIAVVGQASIIRLRTNI